MGIGGSQHISRMLSVNNTLTTLDISYNELGSDDTKYITDALKENNALFGSSGASRGILTYLNISGNNLGSNGARYLVDLSEEKKIL